jgi:hypothetical protein
VHFALNCGARSCPPLAAYDPEHLDAQLDAAAQSYLAGESAVLDGGATVRVPRLLLWYLGDFGGRAGVVRLLGHFGVIGSGSRPRVTFGAYDWTLAVDEPEPLGAAPMTAGSGHEAGSDASVPRRQAAQRRVDALAGYVSDT